MRFTTSTAATLASILASVHTAVGAMMEMGCYSSVEPPLESYGLLQFASYGACREICGSDNKMPVMALQGGTTCYCGDMLPSEDNKVDDKLCDMKCQGYPAQFCTLLDPTTADPTPTRDGMR